MPAKPGDLLAVEICNLGPLPGDEWGYTATFDRENGGGFLTDHFPCATKAIWYFEGIYAYSPNIPGAVVLTLSTFRNFDPLNEVDSPCRCQIPRSDSPGNSWNSTFHGASTDME